MNDHKINHDVHMKYHDDCSLVFDNHMKYHDEVHDNHMKYHDIHCFSSVCADHPPETYCQDL